jgi:hypothetical protein
MKKISKILTLFAILAMIFTSCSPDDFSLGEKDVKPADLVEGIAFKIEHDPSNPNTVYLTNLMDSRYTPLWSHPQGRSQKDRVQLDIAFPGTYEVTFGVETRGGIVYGEPVKFEIKDFYAGFVSDPLWTMLSGGVDNEKTWYLDLDADGVSRYFVGPLYFYGTDDNWDVITNGAVLPEGSDSWSWQADWPGNKWMMDAVDFGSMTFNLKGGANVTVEHRSIPSRGTETGTYMLSVSEYTMRMVDASPLHDSNRDGHVVDWGNIKILSLTENTMQLGVLRDPALSGDGACLLVYNYISKDYYDNWVAGEPEPPYNGNANDDLTSTFTKKWKLSVNTPYNWTGLDGAFLNNWSSAADYASAGYDYNQVMIENISLSMAKTGTNTGSYVFTDGNGTEITGAYKTDDQNNVIFDNDISITISGSQKLATTKDKALRILRSETNESGELSGIWFGKRDDTKEEYMAYHFELATSGSEEEGVEVAVDNSKLLFGDLEGNGNFRIEIYNEYGAGTAADPPVNTADFVFEKSVAVTFTVSGISLNVGAAGSYDTALSYADADWSPQYWGGGSGDITISKDGTYTVWCAPGAAAEGIMVFVIDIKNLSKDVLDVNAITATIDKIVIK